MRYYWTTPLLLISLAVFGLSTSNANQAFAQPPSEAVEAKKEVDKTDQATRFKNFTEMLTGKKLVGSFTVDGTPLDKLRKEEYSIQAVQKMPDGDYWLITSRIKYGNNDVVFPVPIEVKWSEDTPIMTLNDLTIPGLGTFSGRIVFHAGKYAGTWSHDDKGGHMFGHIESVTKDATNTPADDQPK